MERPCVALMERSAKNSLAKTRDAVTNQGVLLEARVFCSIYSQVTIIFSFICTLLSAPC